MAVKYADNLEVPLEEPCSVTGTGAWPQTFGAVGVISLNHWQRGFDPEEYYATLAARFRRRRVLLEADADDDFEPDSSLLTDAPF